MMIMKNCNCKSAIMNAWRLDCVLIWSKFRYVFLKISNQRLCFPPRHNSFRLSTPAISIVTVAFECVTRKLLKTFCSLPFLWLNMSNLAILLRFLDVFLRHRQSLSFPTELYRQFVSRRGLKPTISNRGWKAFEQLFCAIAYSSGKSLNRIRVAMLFFRDQYAHESTYFN